MRSFRISCHLYNQVKAALMGKYLLALWKDATNKSGIYLWCESLQFFAFLLTVDPVTKWMNCAMSASSARESFFHLITEVISAINSDYLGDEEQKLCPL